MITKPADARRAVLFLAGGRGAVPTGIEPRPRTRLRC